MSRRVRTLLLGPAAALLLGMGACAASNRPAATESPAAPESYRKVGALRLEGVPDTPPELRARLAQFQSSRSARLADWHPDGWILMSTRFANTSQLHRLRMPMGARYQLTFDEEPVGSGTILFDGSAMIYARDTGGNENDQLYRYDFATGRHTLLTDGKSRHGGAVLSRRSAFGAYSSNQRNGSDTDVWVRDFSRADQPRLLVDKGGSWGPQDISDDGRTLLVSRYTSVTDSMSYLCDVATGSLTPILDLPEGTKAYVGSAAFSNSGDGSIYYITDHESEFERLCRRNPDGSRTIITPDETWEVESYALSDDGKWLAYSVNAGGMSELSLVDLSSGQRRRIPSDPGLIGSLSFSPDSRSIGLSFSSARTPGDIYTIDVDSLKWTRWTESETGGLDTSTFALPERVTIKSFDGLQFDAWFYRPAGPGPFPVVIDFHGGPEGQTRPWFSPYNQFLVGELGIAVVAPNVRGSTGYGKTFVELDNWRKREDSVKDGGAVLDWIASRPDLDGARVAVTGGSYGGYMVLAMLTTYPERIRAGICSVGISHFVTFLQNTSGYRQDLRRAEYGDERIPEMREFLNEISPLTRANRIKSALFLIHGLNDPRVPWTESEQVAKAARANGATVWTLIAENEGHGFSKKENQVAGQQAQVLFLKSQLLPGR